jgi:hypothetical protein
MRWLVIIVDVTKLAKVGFNELWVPSTRSKYYALMTKLFIAMIRSRDNSFLGVKPIINVFGDLHIDMASSLDCLIVTIQHKIH